MKKLFALLSVVLLSLVIAAVALAADPVATPAASPAPAALAAFLRDSVFPLITAALLGLLAIPLHWLGNKFKIDYLLQKDNAITRLAFQGISLAEEMAAKRVENMAKLTGSEKLDVAVSHILAAMPAVSKEQAERIVESLLAQIPGVGATKQAVVVRDPIVGLATPLAPVQ